MTILQYHNGAIGALLDEYEKAISELKQLISTVGNEELVEIKDHQTADDSSRSLQSILTHVVSSGYSYCVQIMGHKGVLLERPPKHLYQSALEYQHALDEMFRFNDRYISTIKEHEVEQLENDKKITSTWGQLYDIEQMMEHAIVHVLRHRRQINRFIGTDHSG